MKNKKPLFGLIPLFAIVLTGAGVLAARTYVCRFRGRCAYTQYGAVLHYPGSWKAQPTHFYTADGKQHPAVYVQAPHSEVAVSVGLAYGTPPVSTSLQNPSDVTTTAQLVSAERHKSLPDSWDVRVVEESKGAQIDGFIAAEVVLSTANYQRLHLEVGKAVPVDSEGIASDFTLKRRHLTAGTNNQQAIHTLADAQAWFRSDDALQAHRIIASLSVAR